MIVGLGFILWNAVNAGEAQTALSGGSRLVISDVGPGDIFFGDRSKIIGKQCTVEQGSAITPATEGWFGGSVACDDGSYYYFVNFKYVALSAVNPVDTTGWYQGPTLTEGQMVQIVDVGVSDLYYAERNNYIGKECSVSGDLHNNGDTWYGGGLSCSGDYKYWAQVAVKHLADRAPQVVVPQIPSMPVGPSAGVSISVEAGQIIEIVDIHETDIYYPQAATLKGTRCRVTDMLIENSPGWFGGGAMCKGTSYYFYSIAIKPGSRIDPKQGSDANRPK